MRVETLSMKVSSDSESIVAVRAKGNMCSKCDGWLGWADSNGEESAAGFLLPNWGIHGVCNELKCDTPRCVKILTMCWTSSDV